MASWSPEEDRRRVECVHVGAAEIRQGDRVRLRPRGRADIMDLALAGMTAIVDSIEQDFEGRVYLAVLVDDDPGKDLGAMRKLAIAFSSSRKKWNHCREGHACPRYRIDPRQSRFTVQAFATGMLSLFAHSPLFAVGKYNGCISFENDTIQGLHLTIAMDANALELVDRISAADRTEIESRMRNEVLETASYPQVTLHAEVGSLQTITRGHYRIHLVGPLSLHGTEHTIQTDTELEIHDDNLRLPVNFHCGSPIIESGR